MEHLRGEEPISSEPTFSEAYKYLDALTLTFERLEWIFQEY